MPFKIATFLSMSFFLFLLTLDTDFSNAVAIAGKGKHLSITEAPLKIEKGAAKRLFIVGFSGQVTVQPSKTQDIYARITKYYDGDNEVSPDFLQQLVIKNSVVGDVLEIRSQLPPTASDWQKWVEAKNAPQARLEIIAPDTLSLEIYLTHGDVHVNHWKAPVVVTSQEGHLDISDIQGDVTVRSMTGALKLENIKGAVNVENFASAITTSNLNGKVKIRTFSGETHLKKIVGPSVISSQKANVTTQDTQGGLEVQTGVGAIHIGDHKGSLVGHSDSGSIVARIEGPVDARLRSNSGPVTLSIPRDTHASVSLRTSKGTISAPKSLATKRSETGKSVSGDIGGGGGVVRVSSDSGDVTLKM